MGSHATNSAVVVQSNYLAQGSVTVQWWTNVTFTGNTLAGSDAVAILRPIPGANRYEWDRNHYLGTSLRPFSFNGTNLSFPEWRAATGLDSSAQHSTTPPLQPRIFLRPNLYETNRANIIIFNPSRAASVPLDLSSVLSKGTAFELRSSQDFFGPPVLKGRYDGQPIPVPMTGLTSAKAAGLDSAPPPTWPDFNVFVLRWEMADGGSGDGGWKMEVGDGSWHLYHFLLFASRLCAFAVSSSSAFSRRFPHSAFSSHPSTFVCLSPYIGPQNLSLDHRHGPVEMLPALFRCELVGQLASFGGQPAAGSFFRVVELLLHDAVRLSHNYLHLSFPKGVVISGMILSSSERLRDR